MSERLSELPDEALSRRLAIDLPRYTAPPRLHAAIRAALEAPATPRVRWWEPALAALGTALVLILFFVPLLPRIAPADPLQRLTRAVIAEHTRVLMWGERRPDIVPAGLPWVTQESGIGLASVFDGDEKLSLLGAEPVYLDERRGLALHYRDEDGHRISYVVVPAPKLPLPERRRVTIDRFRPALLHDNGFAVLVWKEKDLACFLVADMVSENDLAQFKQYFLRVRTATEPVPAY
jgi:hypothetical protein